MHFADPKLKTIHTGILSILSSPSTKVMILSLAQQNDHFANTDDDTIVDMILNSLEVTIINMHDEGAIPAPRANIFINCPADTLTEWNIWRTHIWGLSFTNPYTRHSELATISRCSGCHSWNNMDQHNRDAPRDQCGCNGNSDLCNRDTPYDRRPLLDDDRNRRPNYFLDTLPGPLRHRDPHATDSGPRSPPPRYADYWDYERTHGFNRECDYMYDRDCEYQ
ncbi:hypothetical protein SCP_0507550 [Sparassis crispa]|uniref:Uncharacterized protein n=1 Tax=Sparassis crispa TaxID=139825 RepID=A0A401GNF6_9APHY|nr:hypothetical protein SCP_0507550 [Sparassis crispa]GBE83699.1 hypothetical protein SCP_0507550 [Sparassis crispa]